jgi:hypothetical protein
VKFGTRVLHKIYPSTCKYCTIQHGVDYSLSAHSTLAVRFGQTSLKDRLIILLNICEFRENWRSEGYNFLMAVNETPLTVVPWNCTIYWGQIVLAGSRMASLLLRDKVRHLDAVRYLFSAMKLKQGSRRCLMSICNTRRAQCLILRYFISTTY